MKVSKGFRFLLAGMIAVLLAPFSLAPTARAVTYAMPEQSHCDNGSTTLTWDGEGVARPQIASMTVDGVAISDPANPALNSLGAVICPGTTKGNRTGLTVVWHTSQGNTDDLSVALTPNGDPVTETTQFAFTMTDLGDRAADYTFALVYGSISSWTTENLGTASAALTFTMSPTRTPLAGGDSDFSGCTAVPPDCRAEKSGEDVLGASLALSFEPNVGSQMSGAYFSMTGAMGGYVTSATASDGSKRLVATLGAPHFLADGTTVNTGSMKAFLPQAVLNSLFGMTSGDVDTSILDVTRTTETTTSSDVPFTITRVTGGALLTVPTITFSSPKYTVRMTAKGLKKKKTIAATPSKSKSTVAIKGSKIKANGRSSYKLHLTVRNKLGKIIKTDPTFVLPASVTMTKPVFKSNQWVVRVSSTTKGTKTIRLRSKGVVLNSVKLNFVKP